MGWWHATASTGPQFHEDGQTARPGNRKGHSMTEAAVSFAGNLTDNPEVRHTEGGIARAMFRVAVSGRREQEASFFTVIVGRDQAEHAAQSLSKGSRVVVVGRLQQRAWSAEDGSARSVMEVVAEELGRACDGRRQPRPGRRGARASSQLGGLATNPRPPPRVALRRQPSCNQDSSSSSVTRQSAGSGPEETVVEELRKRSAREVLDDHLNIANSLGPDDDWNASSRMTSTATSPRTA
jgi:single-strand DNA-binding protein